MIVAVHALVGAALSRLCRTRPQAFALGFVSHCPCDMTPHRDLEIPQEALLLSATLALLAAVRGPESKEIAGAIGGAAPDIENLVGRCFGIPDEKLILPTHSTFHGRKTEGLGPQVAIALACLAVVCWPPRRVSGDCRSRRSRAT